MKKVLDPPSGNAGTMQPPATLSLADLVDSQASLICAGLERRTASWRIGLRACLLMMATPALFAAIVPDDSDPAPAVPVKGLGANHALIIGNHKYENSAWPELPTIPRELEKLRTALTAAGFQLYEGKVHYNVKLSDLRNLMRDFITNVGVGQSKEDDQLLVFFSGHGERVNDRGYIVPVDAPETSAKGEAFLKKAIPFNEIESLAKSTDARHLLFSFDSCFSGEIYGFRGDPPLLPRTVAKIAAGKARKFMTAGMARELVPSRSEFTPYFTKGLTGEADVNHDGYVTGHELFVYLQPKVAAATNNTPRYDGFLGSEYEGDIVFRVSLPWVEPPPFAVGDLNDLFQGTALASAAPEQQTKELKKVQAALFRAQLYDGEHDGRMSKAVVWAINSWQRQHGLQVNGHLDAATLATFSSTTDVAVRSATKETPFINSLSIPFVPVPGTKVLFAEWETRVGDYLRFVYETERPWSQPNFAQTNPHPAVNITGDDAVEFCRWLSDREGVTYRLPSGEEWSLATSANSGGKKTPLYPWGDEFPPSVLAANLADRAAWSHTKKYLPEYEDGFAETAPVGRMRPNDYGIFDLGGNVWEWCADPPASGSEKDLEHYCRGGSWNDSDKTTLSTAFKLMAEADKPSAMIGFRVVLEIPPPPPPAAKDAARAKAVALRMLNLAASYADSAAGRENTPKLVSSFLDLFGLPLKDEDGAMVPYSAAGVVYVASRAYLELKAEPDKPIGTETLRAALPEVRDLLFAPSPAVRVMKADAQERGSWVEVRDATPKPGWLAVFSWGGEQPTHVGIVETFQEGQLTTIEFNSRTAEMQSGGNVVRRVRDLKLVVGYIKTYQEPVWMETSGCGRVD